MHILGVPGYFSYSDPSTKHPSLPSPKMICKALPIALNSKNQLKMQLFLHYCTAAAIDLQII
jgi:hypothetical protein